jgi:hypothetical protein
VAAKTKPVIALYFNLKGQSKIIKKFSKKIKAEFKKADKKLEDGAAR